MAPESQLVCHHQECPQVSLLQSRETLRHRAGAQTQAQTVRPGRDFASGFLVAEICSRYHPVEFEMHSFEQVVSNERKAANWELLEKRFKVCPAPAWPSMCLPGPHCRPQAAASGLALPLCSEPADGVCRSSGCLLSLPWYSLSRPQSPRQPRSSWSCFTQPWKRLPGQPPVRCRETRPHQRSICMGRA